MIKISYTLFILACIQTLILNPCFSQEQKGEDINGLAGFHYAGVVSMPDANTIAIGAPINLGQILTNPGYVRVFEWDGNAWVQKGLDLVGEAIRDQFGFSVSMPNSNTLAVGASSNDGTAIDAGHARIFTWDGSAWIQKGMDIDGLNLGDQFGTTISMPDDNTVAVGAVREDVGGSNSGSVHVYEWDGSNWIQKGTTIGGAATEDLFGSSLSMPDANTVAVGAALNDGNGNASGEVRVFEWTGSDWAQKGADLLGEASIDRFGESVSMPDANHLAVGAIFNSNNGEDAGQVKMFEWDGASWIQKGNAMEGVAGEQLGFSVSAPTPDVIAVGSNANSTNGENAGQVKIYEWNGSSWIQKGVAIDGDAPGDAFGSFVSMPNPGTFASGTKLNDTAGPDAGHARVFSFCSTPSTGIDVQSACDSFTWIDGITYNSSNNSATWTLTNASGCDSIVTLNLTIEDVLQPIPDSDELENIVSQCVIESLVAPTATDNCAGTLAGTSDAVFPITESTMITWTYDDGNGNTSTQTQELIVNDTTAPLPDTAILEDVSAECEITSLPAPTATDNCAGALTGTSDAVFPITESIVITWTYDDGNGNISTQTQELIVNDTMVPIPDAEILGEISSECEVASLVAPTAIDNCDGALTGSSDAVFPITESTLITWTYEDASGNTATQTQEIIITPIDNGISELDASSLGADAEGYTYQWIDCNDGNEPIEGETNQTFTAVQNGSFAVEISNGNCTVSSECIEVIISGIEEEAQPQISVFPNPTSGSITVTSEEGFDRIQITNLLGQTVAERFNVFESNLVLSIPGEPGLYLIHFELDGFHKTTKVFKQ